MSPTPFAERQSTSRRLARLPGGLVLEHGRRFDEAELRPVTGREEDWLAEHPGTSSAIAVTQLLTHCLVLVGDTKPTPELVRKLLVGDRDYLMLQLRRITLGDQFQAVFHCIACDARMDVNFDATEVPVERRPQTSSEHGIKLGDRTVRFRLPCGADQESVLDLDAAEAAATLWDRCILSDGGVAVSEAERAAIEEAMEQLAPQVHLELSLKCPECGEQFLAPFDVAAFFLIEMKVNGAQLLREVHSLAFYYHWSEAEIMDLRRDRRRAYLGILADELKRD